MTARASHLDGARMLKLAEAAEYCGIPARGFRKNVPVSPIRLGPHELWDRTKLDAYIDALQGDGQRSEKDWSAAVAKF